MTQQHPLSINEFPLTEDSARKIMNDLANNHTHRIKWSHHVKMRMAERDITTAQILILLKSKRSVFREGPYEDLQNGSWKFNLKGLAAGKVIELTVALKNHHDHPSSVLVTVWVD
jgi:hypothetical protein